MLNVFARETVWHCILFIFFSLHPLPCLVTKMHLLKNLLSSFNPCKQLFLCLEPWFGETAPPELNKCFRIFSFTINWRQINLQKKNNILIIPFFSVLLSLWCLYVSLGVQDKLGIGNVQYLFVRRLINYKLWEIKDIKFLLC